MIVFLLGLVLSIALHEVGHLVPAKRFGVKVPEYFIGFGPRLWSTRRGETEYGIKLLPLGGYVRLAGMYPASAAPARDKRGRPSVVEEARADSRSDLLPGEEQRAFSALTPGRKLVVMFGGPFMNLVLATVLLAIVLSGIGTSVLTNSVSSVQAAGAAQCAPADPASPALQAGIEPGDAILAWNGTAVASWADVTDAIARGGTAPAEVRIERDGVEQLVTVTPVLRDRPVLDETGQQVLADGKPVTEAVPYVGISAGLGMERQPLTAVPGVVVESVGLTFAAIATIPAQLWGIVSQALGIDSGGSRSLVSIWGVGDLAGQITGSESAIYTTQARVADMLSLVASLNIALFAFNLIPLPPLDGGHIAGALADAVRRGWARLRGATLPRPVDMARLLPLAYVVVWAMIGMAAILVWADISAPIL